MNKMKLWYFVYILITSTANAQDTETPTTTLQTTPTTPATQPCGKFTAKKGFDVKMLEGKWFEITTYSSDQQSLTLSNCVYDEYIINDAKTEIKYKTVDNKGSDDGEGTRTNTNVPRFDVTFGRNKVKLTASLLDVEDGKYAIMGYCRNDTKSELVRVLSRSANFTTDLKNLVLKYMSDSKPFVRKTSQTFCNSSAPTLSLAFSSAVMTFGIFVIIQYLSL